MKKNFIYTLASVLVVAVVVLSCSKSEIEQQSTENGPDITAEPQITTITAYLPEEEVSKVSITEAADYGSALLNWEENDQIVVVDKSGINYTFGIDNESIDGKKASFNKVGDGTIGEGPYTIFYHRSKPLNLDKFNSVSYDGQVQNSNGSTSHLQYGAKLTGVDTYETVIFTQEWADEHSGTLIQNSVLQLLLKLPDGVTEVYSIYAHDDGDFKQTLWLVDGENLFATPNSKHVIKGYMMVPEMTLETGNLTIRVETEDGAYEASYPLIETEWTGGAQYTIQKNMSTLSAVTGEHAAMEIHAKSAQDILQFKAGVLAGNARFTASKVTLEQDIDMTSAGTWNTSLNNTFTGTFGCPDEANRKRLFNLTATAPLFYSTNKKAKLQFFTLEGRFDFTWASSTNDDRYFGSLVKVSHAGTLNDVIVNAAINVQPNSSATQLMDIGGLVGRANNANGKILSCQYIGRITIPSTFSTSSEIRVGGLVGYASVAVQLTDSSFGGTIDCQGGVTTTTSVSPSLQVGGIIGRNQNGIISNCSTNDAPVENKLSEGSDKGSIFVKSSTYKNAGIGGIVGYNYENGSISDCTNNSTILDVVTPTNDDGYTLDVGGIVGNNAASVSSSTNNASSIHLSSSRTIRIGGVVGYDNGSFAGCKNTDTGDISIKETDLNLYVGGVIGFKDNGANSSFAFNTIAAPTLEVSNAADITVSKVQANASTVPCMGGVIGYSKLGIDGGENQKIINSGKVFFNYNLSTQVDKYCLGGIVGITEASIENVKNSGYVVATWDSDANVASKFYLGGIVGKMEGSGSLTNCDNVGGANNKGEVYLNVKKGSAKHTNNYIGGVLGCTDSDVSIANCDNTGYVHGGNATKQNGTSCYAGGIVAKLAGDSSISNCTNQGSIYNDHCSNSTGESNTAYSGGIVGWVSGTSENSIEIESCHHSVSNLAHRRGYSGGIVGYAKYVDISESTVSTNFTGSAYFIGGVAGYAIQSTLSDCEMTGTSIVSSQIQRAGGIVARLGTGSTIDNCTTAVATITKSAAGDDTITYRYGAIAGDSVSGSIIKNCHYPSSGTIAGFDVTNNNSIVTGHLTFSWEICGDGNWTDQGDSNHAE